MSFLLLFVTFFLPFLMFLSSVCLWLPIIVVMSRGAGGSGRGRESRGGTGTAFTFTLQAMNIGRGEALPVPVLAPQAGFPPLNIPCLPLEEEEGDDVLLDIKKNFTACMKTSRFFQEVSQVTRGIERYSDKYSKVLDAKGANQSSEDDFDPRLFPSELFSKPGKKGKKTAKKEPLQTVSFDPNVLLQEEEVETTAEGVPVPAKGSDDEDEAEDGDEDEATTAAAEDEEEETDYMQSYFDNGEEYLDAGSDDNMDEGPTY